MTLRRAHGRARDLGAVVVVEGLPASELPAGVPAPTAPAVERDASGKVRGGPGTTELARKGGLAKAEAQKLRRLLGLADFPEDHPYQPYHTLARELREDHATEVAATIGGGQLSPGVSSIIASASLALAASRYLYDLGAEQGDPALLGQAARLADQSRTSLLTAHELAAREAAARPRRPQDVPWLIAAPPPAPKARAVASHAPQDAPAVVPPAATTPDQAEPSQGPLAPTTEEPHS